MTAFKIACATIIVFAMSCGGKPDRPKYNPLNDKSVKELTEEDQGIETTYLIRDSVIFSGHRTTQVDPALNRESQRYYWLDGSIAGMELDRDSDGFFEVLVLFKHRAGGPVLNINEAYEAFVRDKEGSVHVLSTEEKLVIHQQLTEELDRGNQAVSQILDQLQ